MGLQRPPRLLTPRREHSIAKGDAGKDRIVYTLRVWDDYFIRDLPAKGRILCDSLAVS